MPVKQSIIASVIMLASALSMTFIIQSENNIENRPLNTFPISIGEWRGKIESFNEDMTDLLGVDDLFLASYRNPKGRLIQLYIGFFKSQREGDLIHSPKNCMPGSGWNIKKAEVQKIKINSNNSGTIKVNKLEIQNGIEKRIAIYWYHSRGRVIYSEYLQKAYLILDSITKQRTDGAFIRIIAPVVIDDTETPSNDLVKFTKLVFPILDQFIPA